jgi:hypothetical protein
MKQMQLQIDDIHSTNNNMNTSILLDDSIPDQYKGIHDAYKEYGLGFFFERDSKGGGTSAYFEEYKKNKGIAGTNNTKAKIKSVDPLMEIWMEEDIKDDEPPILHSSSNNSKEPYSRMDTKIKGRNNYDHINYSVTKETTATATITTRPITPDYNNNSDNDNDNGDSNRVYKELTDNDVVFGRGGKANHHIGNIRYRNEIQRLEKLYKSALTRSEKEYIVDTFVQCIQQSSDVGTATRTTNFLEKDKDKDNWFVVDDDIVRRKVHQALRENRDPEKRKAKRRRFLAKKAAAAAAAAAKNKTKQNKNR